MTRDGTPVVVAARFGKGLVIRTAIARFADRLNSDNNSGQLGAARVEAVGAAMTEIGIIAAAFVAGIAVLARSSRVAAWATLGGARADAGAVAVADSGTRRSCGRCATAPRSSRRAGVVALVVVGALAWVIARRPTLLPLLAVGALPFRIPVASGGVTANLLVPLYLVIAAGALA